MPDKRPIIHGTTVYMRNIEPSDAALYARWRSDNAPIRTTGFAHRGPVGIVGAEELIKNVLEKQGQPDWRSLFCLLEDDRPLGEVFLMHLDPHNRTAEFGIFIGDPGDWGKGYGTDALQAMCDFGFGRLDLARIELVTRADNAIGIRSYEKAGFTGEGTKRSASYGEGRRHDLLVMSLLREEWAALSRPKSWELD
jgi:RimJ/RimL family protein N-acetyltransferase